MPILVIKGRSPQPALATGFRRGYNLRMPFQTQNEIRDILKQADMRPQHKHGQHFLVDRNLMLKLVESAEISQDDVVLEIGPGTGSLTNMLAERAARVVSVEIDARIAELARQHLAHHDNVTLLVTDALAGKNHLSGEVLDTFLHAHRQTAGRALLVANLPYNAASPIVADLLLEVPQVQTLCFTVQKEVADRMTANPRTSDFGPLTVVIQALATARRIARVPASARSGRPRTSSPPSSRSRPTRLAGHPSATRTIWRMSRTGCFCTGARRSGRTFDSPIKPRQTTLRKL